MPFLYVWNVSGKIPLANWGIRFAQIITAKYLVTKLLTQCEPILEEGGYADHYMSAGSFRLSGEPLDCDL